MLNAPYVNVKDVEVIGFDNTQVDPIPFTVMAEPSVKLLVLNV